MMKRYSLFHFLLFAVIAVGLTAVTLGRAQAQNDTTQPTSADLAKRIDDLEKELAALKSQVAAQSAAAPAATPAAAAVTSTTAPAPAVPSIASLLGPTTLSGFVDTYYGYNSNQPASRTTAYRNFDINSSQFALNMIELVADKAPDAAASRVGYHVALGFGQAMNAVNSAASGELAFDQYLKEGYLEYLAPVGKGLQINVGKFVTPAGAEVIESKDNWNYSRGLLFAWAIPYFHYGMSAKYAFNSKFALTGYLVNGWNNSIDNNSGKTGGFSAAWTPNAKWSLIENYLFGPEHPNDNSNFRNLSDTVLTYTPNAKLTLMANYDYGSDTFVDTTTTPLTVGPKAHWDGIAGYIKYAPNEKWYIATRGEYFHDKGGFATGISQDMGEFTLTLQRMLAKKIMSRLEYRYDTSDQNVFPYRTSGLPGSPFQPKGYQNTVTVGLIYAFSSADAK